MTLQQLVDLPNPAPDRAPASLVSPTSPTRAALLQRAALPPLPLDCGRTLRHPVLAYHLDGQLSRARDNVVVVLHPLTGSADAAGDWWQGLIGPGLAIDTAVHAVLSPNLLGSCYGSSGPAHDESFPPVTTRDMARAVGVLLEQLGVARVVLVTGGSLGGMVALEFVATFPGRAQSAVVFAAPSAQDAAALGWVHVQREAVRTGGSEGLSLARQIAMLTYRTADGLGARFGRRAADGTSFLVQRWLRGHGERLTARFAPQSYLALLDAMDTHDIARGRGGVGERLRASGARITGVGVSSDLFYPAVEVERWVAEAGGHYRTIESDHGHDAFLLELDQVGAILREALDPGAAS
jgi:homoserine O-acetyltransferase